MDINDKIVTFKTYLNDTISWIAVFVDSVTEAHNEFLIRKNASEFFVSLFYAVELCKELHSCFVCTTMERASKCTNSGGDG